MEKNCNVENLTKVNEYDYINKEYIQAIHVDKDTKTMSVMYCGNAIPVTYSWEQRSICEKYLRKAQLSDVVKILGF